MNIVFYIFSWTTLSQAGKCAEKKMQDKCNCDHRSVEHFFQGYQCSSCIDKNKWGYGCELNCPEECQKSCDFSGNCIAKDPCPENCKRNSRIDDRTDEDLCVNSNGLCQACKGKWYGEMCESPCPTECKESPEGHCKRKGSCYSCKSGYYGERCQHPCPTACPECLMKDGVDADGATLPAGSCTQTCEDDTHGLSCDQTCPEHCDRTGRSGKPSCSRENGHCKRCAAGYHGPKCESTCSSGCAHNTCRQSDGRCEKACKDGFWGEKCDIGCPEHHDEEQPACDRKDGFPASCDATHFPSRDHDGKGKCEECSNECTDSLCGNDGHCTKGCETNWYGPTCSKQCHPGCDPEQGCHRKTGQCKACKPGLTGSDCKEECHSQCATCKQFGEKTSLLNFGGPQPGNTIGDCLSCPEAEASELSNDPALISKCACIDGASRENQGSKCVCAEPKDPMWEAKFETNPKKCAAGCKEDFEGKPLRPVRGQGTTKCIFLDLYNEVAGLWSKFYKGALPKQGDCKPQEYFIMINDIGQCLHEEFVQYIVGAEKFEAKKAFVL